MLLTSITNSNKAQIARLEEGVFMDFRGMSDETRVFIQRAGLITDQYGCKIMELDLDKEFLDIQCPTETYMACTLDMWALIREYELSKKS